MSIIPFEINQGNILVIGAGGGFDLLCGLNIILELESKDYNVILGNYSFTNLANIKGGKWHNDALIEIDSNCTIDGSDYFPERELSDWYSVVKGIDKSVFCLDRKGVQPTLKSYNQLVKMFEIETIICVDGGVDGIFTGLETDMGTPSMDSISIFAAALSNAKNKIYALTAFGTEGAEGNVSHGQALHRMADLIKQNAFLGTSAMTKTQQSTREFISAMEHIFENINPIKRSIVLSTIIASLNGVFGKESVHPKTDSNPPWISPLTSLIWYFDAVAVADSKLFKNTNTLNSLSVLQVSHEIEKIRSQNDIEPFEEIPI